MKINLLLYALVATALAMPVISYGEGDSYNPPGHEERGAGPHGYHKGDRLRAEDHRSEYVVNDWHSRNLREPPRGYHWVQHGDDFVLAAIATGVIADVMLHH